jgi:hypothetical protein
MKLRFTERADRDYAELPVAVRKSFAKQLRFLLADLRHPSLQAKKYSESMDVWQARVTGGWRFYFKMRVTNTLSSLSSPTRSKNEGRNFPHVTTRALGGKQAAAQPSH